MRKYNVYNSDGSVVRASTKDLEYNGEYMGECSLTITFESRIPIDFHIGDYIDYREDRFYLNVVPHAKKQCSLNGSRDAFVYENVKFDSALDELSRCDFLDVVPNDSNIHWTALPTFSFYCGSVYDLVNRIQANLDRVYGSGAWKCHVNESNVKRWKDMSISIDKQTVWDALSLVYNNYKTNFIVRGRNIYIGSTGNGIGHTFKYGVGNGLKSLERTVDDSQKVITRLRAYGNTTNIPSAYYKYLSMFINCDDVVMTCLNKGAAGLMRVEILCKDAWAQDKLSYAKVESVYTSYQDQILPIKYTDKDGVERSVFASVYYNTYNGETKIYWGIRNLDFFNYVDSMVGRYPKITAYGTSALNYNYLIRKYATSINYENYPNNMAVTRLMLPGFPTKNGTKDCSYVSKEYSGYKLVYKDSDVYIDSPNIDTLGVREGTVYLDGSDNETTDIDIYPSIQNMTKKELEKFGIVVNLKPYDNGNLDEVLSAEPIEDNGDADFNSSQAATTTIYLKDIGFNPFNYRTTETPTIYMKSGMCVGREFDITNIVKEEVDGYTRYKIVLSRKNDNDLNIVYPNSDFPIKAGDEFVLLHIKMPDLYYEAASEKLLEYALKFFVDNDKTKFTYTPEIDNIWMARQNDEAEKNGEKSIYKTIKEGDKLMFDESADLGAIGNVFIGSLKIKESKDSLIPEYEIQLEDNKTTGGLARQLGKLSSSVGGNSGGGDGLTIDQIKSLIKDQGNARFLSKNEDDEANGHISFNKGIETFADENSTAADGIVEYFEYKGK